MSTETPSQNKPALIDADAVADYLAHNHDFFIGRGQLLEAITIPHESGNAISLVERQVISLRARTEEQSVKIQELLETASANDALFEKTRTLILALLKCNDLPMLSQTLNQELGELFNSVESHLFFITDHPENYVGLAVKPYTEANAVLGEFFSRKRTYCGTLAQDQASFFFPQKPETVASAAIVPIHLHHDQYQDEADPILLPVLVTGSTDAEYFHNSQDTLFLDFIGEILSALIHNLLPGD